VISLRRLPDRSWKRPPRRSRNKWLDHTRPDNNLPQRRRKDLVCEGATKIHEHYLSHTKRHKILLFGEATAQSRCQTEQF